MSRQAVSRHRPMASPSLTALLLLVVLLLLDDGGGASAGDDLQSDRVALLTFRAAFPTLRDKWDASAASPCAWTGVTCDGGRVIVLRLPGTNLLGPIPANSVGKLTALRTLSLRLNALSGPLPADLAGAVVLRKLYLQGNHLSGKIPRSIPALYRLERLNLADNAFNGEIPPALNNLTRLTVLHLERNALSGEIPDLNLPHLVEFNLSFNRLNGSIPGHLRRWPATSFLSMPLCGTPLPACPDELSSPAPSPAAFKGSSSSKSKLSPGAIAGIAVGSVVALLIIALALFLLCRRKPGTNSAKPPDADVTSSEVQPQPNTPPVAAEAAAAAEKGEAGNKLVFIGGGGPGAYDLEDLLRASAEVLGKGMFGTTYKAVLELGRAVAVKRLKDVNLPDSEFRDSVEAVGRIVHPNVVSLQAYYYSKDEKLLVYDFMPMGSLSELLHGNRGTGRTAFDWETRFDIALAAAKGIENIHSVGPSVSHGNIKSSNILLAKSYVARVAEHGLAQLSAPTSSPTHTAGYSAPEVTDIRMVSQKADVYSFGVLLLELLTSKPPQQALVNNEGVDLPRWVQSIFREKWTSEVFDSELLRYQNAEEQMVQLLQLAIDCAAQHPDERPSMSEVVGRIEEIGSSSERDVERDQHYHQHQTHSFDDAED